MAKLLLMCLAILGMTCLSVKAQGLNASPLSAEAVPVLDDKDPEDLDLDREFDNSILTDEGKPPKGTEPQQKNVEALYQRQKQRIVAEAARSGDGDEAKSELVEVNLYYKYYTLSDWNVVLRCCPAKQRWGCRAVPRRLPCFSHIVNGRREWCCPFYPTVYVSYCNCYNCAILTSDCARLGTCQRRYRLTTYYAVCYRNNWWGYIRRFQRSLPYSCYCRAKNC